MVGRWSTMTDERQFWLPNSVSLFHSVVTHLCGTVLKNAKTSASALCDQPLLPATPRSCACSFVLTLHARDILPKWMLFVFAVSEFLDSERSPVLCPAGEAKGSDRFSCIRHRRELEKATHCHHKTRPKLQRRLRHSAGIRRCVLRSGSKCNIGASTRKKIRGTPTVQSLPTSLMTITFPKVSSANATCGIPLRPTSVNG